mgnify:FL=1
MSVGHKVILNRISRLARQALAVHATLLSQLQLQEDLAADGFESFVDSQYEPNNIHILVGSDSQLLYSFDYAHLKRKGRMTELQKAERERREEEAVGNRTSITTSFTRIISRLEELIEGGARSSYSLYTDEKREYVTVIKKFPQLRQMQEEGRFVHERISSRKARTLNYRLFPVNYFDREIRIDNANHVRETVQFSRRAIGALERLAIYQMYHNYCKSYRIGVAELEYRLHGEVEGIKRESIRRELADVFTMRRFLSKVKLGFSQAMVWLQTVGNVGSFNGGYRPAYVWM